MLLAYLLRTCPLLKPSVLKKSFMEKMVLEMHSEGVRWSRIYNSRVTKGYLRQREEAIKIKTKRWKNTA
jgi:hypothetical protein